MGRFVFVYEERASFNYSKFCDYMWNDASNARILTTKKFPKFKFAKTGEFQTAVAVELGVSKDTAKEIIDTMRDLGFMGLTNQRDEPHYCYPKN